MHAAAFLVLELSRFQLVACVLIVIASCALAFLVGIDEGLQRGRSQGRRLAQEARERARQQLREETWFPSSGRGHR
jgi:hypothetical protein